MISCVLFGTGVNECAMAMFCGHHPGIQQLEQMTSSRRLYAEMTASALDMRFQLQARPICLRPQLGVRRGGGARSRGREKPPQGRKTYGQRHAAPKAARPPQHGLEHSKDLRGWPQLRRVPSEFSFSALTLSLLRGGVLGGAKLNSAHWQPARLPSILLGF